MQNKDLKTFVHDITTPLSMVKLNLDLLNQENNLTFQVTDRSRNSKLLRRIASGINELDYLVTMGSHVKAPLVYRSTIIKEIRKLVSLYDLTFARDKINVQFNFAEDYFLTGSIDKFHRVMLNLINNAMQAVASNHKQKRIVISTQRENEGFVLKIYDNGCGIKKENLSRIFDYRFSTKPKGGGLGLFNVKNLLLEHFGGFITCTSVEGRGSQFEVILPDPE